ncbi:MAG TPA: hypothetical protein VF281_00050 [Candidatus Saccharimonadales bacterium]
MSNVKNSEPSHRPASRYPRLKIENVEKKDRLTSQAGINGEDEALRRARLIGVSSNG